jgi:hypothetical protein
VTTGGLTALDAESLRVLMTADAARNRLEGVPLPPGLRSYLGYTVLADDDAEAVFVYETTGIDANYAGYICVQAALIALDPNTGQRIGSWDARDPITGQPLCALGMAGTRVELCRQERLHARPGDHGPVACRAHRAPTVVFAAGPKPSQNGLGIFRASGHTMLSVSPSYSSPFFIT